MGWFSLFAIYFIIWWVTLFAVLPFGSRSQAEEGSVAPGTDPGAPANLKLGKKLLINTIVSGVLLVIYWFMTEKLGYSLFDLTKLFR